MLIERKLRECLRDANVLRGVTGHERFNHYFVDAKVNVGSRWRVKEGGRKVSH